MKTIHAMVIMSFLVFSSTTKLNADNETGKYFASQEYQKLLYDFGVYWDRKVLNIQENCMSQYTINPISFAILKPLKFSSTSATPIEGTWTYRYKFTRCGESIIYNALNIARDNQNPQIVSLVPGTTNCAPMLIKDAYNGIYANLVVHNAQNNTTCKTAQVLNTEITMPQTAQNQIWEEKWTIKECDNTVETSFCFTPSEKGGTNWIIGKCNP